MINTWIFHFKPVSNYELMWIKFLHNDFHIVTKLFICLKFGGNLVDTVDNCSVILLINIFADILLGFYRKLAGNIHINLSWKNKLGVTFRRFNILRLYSICSATVLMINSGVTCFTLLGEIRSFRVSITISSVISTLFNLE